MSILIHMQMPKDGECVVVFPGGVVQKYKAGGIAFFEYQDRTEEHVAVQLPPHGRLIEADKLMANIKAHDYLLTAMCNSQENGMFTCGIQQAVDEADTIIPEDPGGEPT